MLPPLQTLCLRDVVGTHPVSGGGNEWSNERGFHLRNAAIMRGERVHETEDEKRWVYVEEIEQDANLLKYSSKDQKMANGGDTYALLCFYAARKDGSTLRHVDASFLPGYKEGDLNTYFQICLAATAQTPSALAYMPPQYKKLQEANLGEQLGTLFLACVKEDGRMLRYVPIGTKSFELLASAAVEQNYQALEYVPPKRTYYVKLAKRAIRKYGYSLRLVPKAHPEYRYLMKFAEQNYTIEDFARIMKSTLSDQKIDEKYGPDPNDWKDADEYGNVEAPAA